MRSLVFIRHSTPELDPQRHPCTWPLSPAGQAAASELGRELTEYAPKVVVTSPELKAVETAVRVASDLGAEVEVDQGFREHQVSRVKFFAPDEFKQLVRRYFKYPDDVVYGDECGSKAFGRFAAAVRTTLSRYPGNIAVVTHGRVLATYVAGMLACSAFEFWQQMPMPAVVVAETSGAEETIASFVVPWLLTLVRQGSSCRTRNKRQRDLAVEDGASPT